MAPKQVLGFGKFSRKLTRVGDPLGTIDKSLKAVKANPNDPLNLAHEKQMKDAETEAKDAEALAEEARQQQMVDSAELDDEENRRIKKLLSGSRGARGYRGGSMFRGRPSNTAARSAASAGGAGGSPGASQMRSGGRAGGLGSFRYANESVNQ